MSHAPRTGPRGPVPANSAPPQATTGKRGPDVYVDSLPSEVTELRKAVIFDLRKRAAMLQTRNVWLLGLIVLVLALATYAIVEAGWLVSRDVTSAEVIQLMEKRVEELKTRERNLEGARQRLQQESDKMAAVARAHPESPNFQTMVGIPQGVQDNIANGLKEIDAAQKELQDLRDKTVSKFLVASAVTRVGILTIVIFLVQILVGLYRYNARIASTCLAQADSIALLGVNSKKLSAVVNALTPNIGFDKGVTTLPEKALEAVRVVFEKKGGA